MTAGQQRTVELAGRLHVLDRRGIRELGKHPSLADAADLMLARERLADEGARRRRIDPRPWSARGAHPRGRRRLRRARRGGRARAGWAQRRDRRAPLGHRFVGRGRGRCAHRRRQPAPRCGAAAARLRRGRHEGSRRSLRYHPRADDDHPPRLAAPGRGGEPGARGRRHPRRMRHRRPDAERHVEPDRILGASHRERRADAGADADADPRADAALHERAGRRAGGPHPRGGRRTAGDRGAVRRVRPHAG